MATKPRATTFFADIRDAAVFFFLVAVMGVIYCLGAPSDRLRTSSDHLAKITMRVPQ